MASLYYGKMDMLVATRVFLSSAQEALERGEYHKAVIEANKVIEGIPLFKVSPDAYRDQRRRRALGSFLRDAHLVNVEALLAISLAQFRDHGYTPDLKSKMGDLFRNARRARLPILEDIRTLQQRLEETAPAISRILSRKA
ncbi:hypothetical protein HYS50_01915 [Candidatus Woesearchaeota archaeon]|nr:hypothetical protein [Candidatus Woesearchaeota archaeon]